MKKIAMEVIYGIVALMIMACGNTNTQSEHYSNIPGESVGLIVTWIIDEEGNAIHGTATFGLHNDDGTYYVDFNGEACRLTRISPIDIDDVTLCYTFTTNWGGTYFLEDISNPSKRVFNLN